MADPKLDVITTECGIAPARRLVVRSIMTGDDIGLIGACERRSEAMSLIVLRLGGEGGECVALTFHEARDLAHEVEHMKEVHPLPADLLGAVDRLPDVLRWFTDEIEAGRDPTDG